MNAFKAKETWSQPEVVPVRNRDQELVRFVGRYGLVAMRHVMEALGVGQTAAYRRVGKCINAGLLERLQLLRSETGLIRATRDGLQYAGLGLPVASISVGGAEHTLRCATVGLEAEQRYGADRVLTEREFRFAEQIEGRRIAAAKLNNEYDRPRLHRADLAILTDEGTIAVEVELTPKAPKRLRQLIGAWTWATIGKEDVVEVCYLCAPGQTRRAVERVVEKERRFAEHIVVDEVPPR